MADTFDRFGNPRVSSGPSSREPSCAKSGESHSVDSKTAGFNSTESNSKESSSAGFKAADYKSSDYKPSDYKSASLGLCIFGSMNADADTEDNLSREFYRKGESPWTHEDLKQAEKQIERQSMGGSCDVPIDRAESRDLRHAVEGADHRPEAVEIHMALFDEDETEWEAPAWCEWARGFNKGLSAVGAEFSRADLRQADFRSACLALADFVDTDARDASFRSAELTYADFRGACLAGADFCGADLAMVNFSNCDLRGSNLVGVDLAQAVLKNADLRGAHLSGARLEGADLQGSLIDFTTELPFPREVAETRGARIDQTLMW